MKKNAYRCLIAASMILLQPNVIGYAAVPAVTANASAVSTVAEDNQQTESIENEDQNENQNTEEKNDISGNTTDDVRSEEDQNTENTTDENETLQSDKPAEQTQIQSKAVAKKGKWIKNNKGWWYAYEDGTWPKDEIVEINGVNYGFNASGYMVTGWHKRAEGWYYFKSSGAMQTGWLKLGKTWYYLDGANAEYKGLMAQNEWHEIDHATYYFNNSGYMQIGWQKLDGNWYYMKESGARVTGWLKLGKIWYYLNEEGIMQTDWQKVKKKWYYMNGSGAMQTGWQKIRNIWYYMNRGGAMQTGWQKINNRWYYLKESGAMTTGWLQLGDTWYYLNSSGVMITGWSHIGKYDYYFETSGAMVTGWKEINNSRYYFYLQNDENNNAGASYGSKAVNVEIDGWTIKEDGKAYDLSEIDKKIEEIKKYTTIPYVYGGSSTLGWDCSGFTQWAVRYLSGVTIPRTSQQQATGGTPVNINKMKEWKPGDVLVYSNGYSYDHVALYLGKGMLMHALNSKYGTVIQDIQYYESWDSKNHLAMVRRYF